MRSGLALFGSVVEELLEVPVLLVLTDSELLLDLLLDLLLRDPTPAPNTFNLSLTCFIFTARFAREKGSAAGAKMAWAFDCWAKMAFRLFCGERRPDGLTDGLGKPEDPTDNGGAGDQT